MGHHAGPNWIEFNVAGGVGLAFYLSDINKITPVQLLSMLHPVLLRFPT
jgi:hypothetical protein